MSLLYEAEQRRLRSERADRIEDTATAYRGCREEKHRKLMQHFVGDLRKG